MRQNSILLFIIVRLHKLIGNPKLLLNAAISIGKALSIYRDRPLGVLKQVWRMSISEGYLPEEAIKWGLLNPQTSAEAVDMQISYVKLYNLRKPFIPESWVSMTADKSIFYNYCSVQNIPIPRLYAVLYTKTSGWTEGGALLRGKKEWTDYLRNKLPAEFVLKPTLGQQGEQINFFRQTPDGFYEITTKRSFTAPELYDFLARDKKYSSFIIQERVRNHEAIQSLNNADFLQTIRLVTVVDKHGGVRVVYGILKIIHQNQYIDNFHNGLTGNSYSVIDLETGRLTKCFSGQVNGDEPHETGPIRTGSADWKDFKYRVGTRSCG